MRDVASFALAAVLVISGCSTASPSDASAPILVRGVVHDIAERPVGAAELMIEALGVPSQATDEPGPVLLQFRATAGPDGTFELRATPNASLRAAAVSSGGTVTFFLTAQDGTGATLGQWEFQRTLTPDGWSGEPPGVVIRPVNSGPDGCC
jgi:hypothetical protein